MRWPLETPMAVAMPLDEPIQYGLPSPIIAAELSGSLRFGECHLQPAPLEGAHLARKVEAHEGWQRFPVEQDLDLLELLVGLGLGRGGARGQGAAAARPRSRRSRR